jgi:hypothetical protein
MEFTHAISFFPPFDAPTSSFIFFFLSRVNEGYRFLFGPGGVDQLSHFLEFFFFLFLLNMMIGAIEKKEDKILKKKKNGCHCYYYYDDYLVLNVKCDPAEHSKKKTRIYSLSLSLCRSSGAINTHGMW